MIECNELAGKVIRRCTIDKDGVDGSEIHIELADGMVFSVCHKTDISIATKPIVVETERMLPGE